jgi:hypothetical protein
MLHHASQVLIATALFTPTLWVGFVFLLALAAGETPDP